MRRAFEEGHGVAIHWHSRELMFKGPAYVASTIQEAAAESNWRPDTNRAGPFVRTPGIAASRCSWAPRRRAIVVVGWSWMLLDFNWFRKRNADDLVPRLANRASNGDIIVIHDGHHKNPRADRPMPSRPSIA